MGCFCIQVRELQKTCSTRACSSHKWTHNRSMVMICGQTSHVITRRVTASWLLLHQSWLVCKCPAFLDEDAWIVNPSPCVSWLDLSAWFDRLPVQTLSYQTLIGSCGFFGFCVGVLAFNCSSELTPSRGYPQCLCSEMCFCRSSSESERFGSQSIAATWPAG